MFSNLPLWVQYVSALGPPVAAVLAACLVAYFAWRNWQVAKGKLKADLFDKRYALYKQLREDFAGVSRNLQRDFSEDPEQFHGMFTGFLSDRVGEVTMLFGFEMGDRLFSIDQEMTTRLGRVIEADSTEADGRVRSEAQEWWSATSAVFRAELEPYMDLSAL